LGKLIRTSVYQRSSARTLYEYDAGQQEGDTIDYFLNVIKKTIGSCDTTALSSIGGCPDKVAGDYDVINLRLVNNLDSTFETFSTGIVSTITSTDGSGDPVGFNYSLYRSSIVSILSSQGITGYFDGNIFRITSSAYNIENHRLESDVFFEECESVMKISFDIIYETRIELTPSMESIPTFDDTMIDFIFIPAGCGTIKEFDMLFQEINNLHNLNC
jgi:hypothetical protein